MAASLDLEGGTRQLPRLAYKSRTRFAGPSALRLAFIAALAKPIITYQRRIPFTSAPPLKSLNEHFWISSTFSLDTTRGTRSSYLLDRLQKTDTEFQKIFRSVRDRGTWTGTFVDEYCEPPETFTVGGMFAHIITFNSYRRLVALEALRRLGAEIKGSGCPMDYERVLAEAPR